MNHENKVIIENTLTSAILLHIISVSFNSISNSSKTITIPEYLNFLKQKKLEMNNPFSIDKSIFYEQVILINFL